MTIALTRLTLGFHLRLLLRWEWETLIPNETPFPQMSHLAIVCTSFNNGPDTGYRQGPKSQRLYFIRFCTAMQVFFCPVIQGAQIRRCNRIFIRFHKC